MRKSLLLLMVSLTVLSASAQLSRSDRVAVASRQDKVFTHANPAAFGQSMQMRTPGETVLAPRKASHPGFPYYNRPAGAFYSAFVAENGVYMGSFAQGFMLVKPFNDYTYHGVANGAENGFSWWYNMDDGNGESNAQDLTPTCAGYRRDWWWPVGRRPLAGIYLFPVSVFLHRWRRCRVGPSTGKDYVSTVSQCVLWDGILAVKQDLCPVSDGEWPVLYHHNH